MRYYTDDELATLRKLQVELHGSVSHSKEARLIGRQIAEINRQAHIRNNPPNPTIDRAMKQLSKQLGIE